MKRDSKSSLDDITTIFQPNGSRSETPIDQSKFSRITLYTPYPLYQQKIRALLKPPDYQRNPPKFMSVREPRSEFEKKEAAIQVKLLKKTFNTMHQRFSSVDKVLTMLKSESIKINALRSVGESDLEQLQHKFDALKEDENTMLSKIKDEFTNNTIYKHVRERMRQTLMHLEVKNQYLTDQIKLRDFLIESEHRKKIKTLENKYTKVQACKNLQKTLKLDFKDRSADLELLEEDISTREKIHELREKRIKKYEVIAETAANEERDVKNNTKREAVLINTFWAKFLSYKQRASKSKFGYIELAFEKIQLNALVHDINDVVTKFLVREHTFVELMGILKHNKEKCGKMIKKNDLIEGKIDDLLLAQKSDLDSNIVNMKESMHNCIGKVYKARERLARMKVVKDKVHVWTGKMLKKLGVKYNGKEKLGELFFYMKNDIVARLSKKEKTMFITEL